MMLTATHFLLLGAVVSAQSVSVVSELRQLALSGNDSALSVKVNAWPDETREAARELLLAVAAEPVVEEQRRWLSAAQRLAGIFNQVWDDPILVHRVATFTAWSPGERRRYARADSALREGNAKVARDGVTAAMREWRVALRLFTAVADTAGMAAALGNLGWGFGNAGESDSCDNYLARALVFAEAVGDRRVAANTAAMHGLFAYDSGDLTAASELHTRALVLHERSGNYRGIARDHNNLGLIAEELGDYETARRHYEAALSLNLLHENSSSAAHNHMNLGNLASYEVEYSEASTHYLAALDIYRQLSESTNIADALYNLALLQIRRGDYPDAELALSEAVQHYAAVGDVESEIAVRQTLATVHAAMGDLQAGLDVLDRAERSASELEWVDPLLLADLSLARADLSVQFNMYPEAQRQYEGAATLYRESNDGFGLAETQQGTGRLLIVRENYGAAKDALEAALRVQQRSGDPRSAAWTSLLLSEAEMGLGDTAAARERLQETAHEMAELEDAVGEAVTLAALADIDVAQGLALSAESLYVHGLTLVDEAMLPQVAWLLHAGIGDALSSRGAYAEAAAAYQSAITQVEQVSGKLQLEERRAAFLADKWEVYRDLVFLEAKMRRVSDAFEVSERMRARQMLDLLARGHVTPSPERARELATIEQDVRHRINELLDRLSSPEFATTAERGLPGLTEERDAVLEALAMSQRQYAELLLDIRSRSPDYGDLVTGETVPAAEIRRRLAGDQVLVEYLVGDSTSLAFVLTSDTLVAIDLNVTRRALANSVEFARGALVRPDRVQQAELWRAPLRRLYRQLVEPLDDTGLLAGKRTLLIAPHAELHYLPFDALVANDAGEFLVERYDIGYVPSASVWVRLAQRHGASDIDRVLALAPKDQVLPGSAEEANAVGEVFGNRATVLTGDRATEEAVVSAAGDADILHLASYGVLNKHNPLFSYIELNRTGDYDGRLEVHEVFGLDLHARLVVLSACQTGLGSGALADVPEGDDWIGLVRAFLFAGADNVVATLWPVEDRATARLMTEFYAGLQNGSSPTAALARAKRIALLNSDTASPFYWAGFALVGSP
jgi:CHAT domain-containing protein